MSFYQFWSFKCTLVATELTSIPFLQIYCCFSETVKIFIISKNWQCNCLWLHVDMLYHSRDTACFWKKCPLFMPIASTPNEVAPLMRLLEQPRFCTVNSPAVFPSSDFWPLHYSFIAMKMGTDTDLSLCNNHWRHMPVSYVKFCFNEKLVKSDL